MRALVMICCLLMAHCAPYTADLRLSGEWKATDAASLSKAAFEWNEVTVPNRHVGPTDVPTFRSRGETWLIIKRQQPPDRTATTFGDRRAIEINPDVDGDDFYLLIKHELGHVIGIHDHTKTGVMHKEVSDGSFTEEVIEACRKVSACP